LRHCENITDFSPLLHLTGLRHLDLSSCTIFNVELISMLKGLKILKLKGCINLRDITSLQLLNNLNYLNLKGCSRICNNIEPFMAFKKLQFINLKGCTLLQENGVADVLSKRTDIMVKK
jgi:Leucine-rich repeat (LRR) protein